MIEVEKKFRLNEDVLKNLLEGAEFVSECEISDVYYDTEEFTLTKNDIWLRQRDGEMQLKIPAYDSGMNSLRSHTEIKGEKNIRQVFAIVKEKSFLDDIEVFGYAPFCRCRTTRKKYRKGDFMFDLELGFFEDFEYSLIEIELMVGKREDVRAAEKKIIAFAESLGLENRYVHGKIIEYLLRKRPKHYKVLVEKGIIPKVF